jgi:hypothetical protein
MSKNQDPDNEKSILYVRKGTKKRFKKFGKMGETQDKLQNRMIDHISTCDRWWNHEE